MKNPKSTNDSALSDCSNANEFALISPSDTTTRLMPTAGDTGEQQTDPLQFMSRQEESNMGLSLWQTVRKYPKLVGWLVSLVTVVIGWGFDTVIVGSITSLEAFQEDYGDTFEGKLIIPSVWLSLWTASTPLGMVAGSVFAGWVSDRIGRRKTLLVASVISALSIGLIFCSHLPPDINAMRAMFTVGKLIQGFSIGMLKIVAITYMSENAPVALRGSVMAMIPAGNLLGQLIGAVLIYAVNDLPGNSGYLIALGVQWVFAVSPLVLSISIPESPFYLLNKDRLEEAFKAAERLYSRPTNIEQVLEDILKTINEEKRQYSDSGYLECFHTQNRRRTWIVLLANLYPALFGIDLISRGSYFLQTLGMDSSITLIMLIMGIVLGCLANIGGIWVMARVGRRPAIMASLSAATVLWAGMAISGFWQGSVGNENPVVYWYTAGTLMAIIIVVSLGVWPATYAVIGETSSLRLRSKTQGLGNVAQQASSVVISIVTPFIYNLDAGAFGARTGFFFMATCIISVVGTFYLLPEMKGRSAAELDVMFTAKIPARKFSKWEPETLD